MRLKNCKGFTLAELLIVIAIIAALVAVMIPSFGKSIETARENADVANIRAAYSEASTKNLLDSDAPESVKIEHVVLSSTGAIEYAETKGLPFKLPEDLSITKGSYDLTFDFTGSIPTVTLAASPATPTD